MGKPSAKRRQADNEAMAYCDNISVSQYKLNLVAESIRGKNADAALAELEFSSRRISADVRKVLQSAIANAENNHQLDVDRLYISEATVGRAFALKRFRARARGRAGKIVKPFSNITVVVREREEKN